jgi:hypothetical protein
MTGDGANEGATRPVRDTSEATWWRRTRQLAAAIAGSALFLELLLLHLRGPLDGNLLFGLPFGTFLAGVVAPLLLAAAAFFFTTQQRMLDRRHDVAED